MPAYYPLLTLISVVFFVWLARRLALKRNRNVVIWGVAGAVLPPALVILYALKPLPEDGDADEDGGAQV